MAVEILGQMFFSVVGLFTTLLLLVFVFQQLLAMTALVVPRCRKPYSVSPFMSADNVVFHCSS